MLENASVLIDEGKKSLDTLLREKAYSDVQDSLKGNGIDVKNVSDEDIENLVAAKTQDMMNGIKGFGMGTAFAFVLSMLMEG